MNPSGSLERMDLAELLASHPKIGRFRALLSQGGVAAVPTETFYALATDPTNERGVSRVFEIKGRDHGKPLLVLFSDRGQLDSLGVASAPLDRFFAVWPAPLTVVLRLRSPIAASRRGATLAVRMPAAAGLRRLLSAVGPLTGTSANRSGDPPLADPDAVAHEFGSGLDLLVDGGPTAGGEPSTVIDATQEPIRVLRRGAFRWPAPEE